MLTPEYLFRITEASEESASALHTDVIKRIIRCFLDTSRATADSQGIYYMKMMEHSAELMQDLQSIIAKQLRVQENVVASAFEEAGIETLKYDSRIYERMGIKSDAIELTPKMIRMARRNYEATMGEYKNFTRSMANQSNKLFLDECDKAYMKVMNGTESLSKAFRTAIDNIANNGVVVTYPSGHKDTIETATLRTVRTGVNQASAQIQFVKMQENNCNLVLTSAHIGARPSHFPWQGRVFYVDWSTFNPYTRRSMNETIPNPATRHPKYPDFVESTRYGYVDGLCGANCRHSFSPYKEGMVNPYQDFDSENNQKAYDLGQRQRALERRIRRTKRLLSSYSEAINNSESETEKTYYQNRYDRHSAILQRQNADYRNFCSENSLKQLADRTKVARWSRSDAAKAVNAARRYNKR